MGLRQRQQQETVENCIARRFVTCAADRMLLVMTSRRGCVGRGEVHTGFWWGDLREGDSLEDLRVDGTRIGKWVLME